MVKGFIFLTLSILLAGCTKADCNSKTDPSTPLNLAIRSLINDDPSPAKKLLDSGMSPNKQNECGASLLHISIIAGNNTLAQRIIQMGGNSNLENYQKETPVFMAANWSRNDVLKMLLLKNGNPNHQVNTSSAYNTPLLIAATNGNTDGVEAVEKPQNRSKFGKISPL